MLKVVTVEHMRRIEAAADASGVSYATMMENAGTAAAQHIADYLEHTPAMANGVKRILFLIGKGNNGGDGLVAGRVLATMTEQYQVQFYLLAARPDDDLNFQAVQATNLTVTTVQEDSNFQILREQVAAADVVVDALFGIGVHLPLRSDAVDILHHARAVMDERTVPQPGNIAPNQPKQSALKRPYVVAVDCPSGLDCDTGTIDEAALLADATVTFIAAKPGLLAFPGAAYVGELVVSTIGVPDNLPELHEAATVLVDGGLARSLLPARTLDSNKGTFGKALVVAGSANYVGAAGLSAMAAYRSGTGLVTVGAAGPVVHALAGHFLGPTWLLLPHDMGVIAENAVQVIGEALAGYSALLLGPGWGQESTTREFLLKVLDLPRTSATTHKRGTIGFISSGDNPPANDTAETPAALPPLVIDADGLNLLAGVEQWWERLPADTIITPHPGEMARLAGLTIEEVQTDRTRIAQEKAAEWGVVLVLKGAHTLIATPDKRLFVLPFKTDALATAGTGDVLAGTITGLLAQGVNPVDAAVLGGYVQGLAGEYAARQIGNTRSVTAEDVLNNLAAALTAIEQS
ncbi:MAG: bifunctional ADP-dependent NAD(P)H-hydrate dehydratase/NAD(P)H-hydrate epimerase [Anaerolineaceae bacterium]|nr:bifunctional ADP-dependent NAD(P)H-hydrate dehydratase/NAD(P)H-hydrate epimerase [Anaerolineaceae bacterium]